MIKYRGRYRVVFEMDKQTGKPLEACFIRCRHNINICRHNDSVLNAYIPSRMKATYLLKMYPSLFILFQSGDKEATLLFKETDIEKAAGILGAMVKGANVSPKSRRNSEKHVANL